MFTFKNGKFNFIRNPILTVHFRLKMIAEKLKNLKIEKEHLQKLCKNKNYKKQSKVNIRLTVESRKLCFIKNWSITRQLIWRELQQ